MTDPAPSSQTLKERAESIAARVITEAEKLGHMVLVEIEKLLGIAPAPPPTESAPPPASPPPTPQS